MNLSLITGEPTAKFYFWGIAIGITVIICLIEGRRGIFSDHLVFLISTPTTEGLPDWLVVRPR